MLITILSDGLHLYRGVFPQLSSSLAFGSASLRFGKGLALSSSCAFRLAFTKLLSAYQLAFFTPGIWPLYASSRKQIRQIPYFLKYACGRPQIRQRLYSLVENFCLRCCFTFIAVLAMNFPSYNYFANGMLNNVNNSRASSSVLAVVTKITSIPLTLSTLSYSTSGKISCSLIPRA